MYGTLNANKLKPALTSIGAEVKGTTLPFLVTLNGHDFTISEDGTAYDIGKNNMNIAKLKVEISEIDERIKTAEDNGDEDALENAKADKLSYYQGFYGKAVNYEPKTTIQTSTSVANTPKKAQWKIFYADESHIYLIADSYVTYDSLPSNEIVSFAKSNESNLYTANFNNSGLLSYYAGGVSKINDFSKASMLKELNYDFFHYKNPSTNFDEPLTGTFANGVSYGNMRTLASMLDSDFWDTKYKDNSGYAEYTIGGPSIEMLFASYNQTHETNFGAKAYKAEEKYTNPDTEEEVTLSSYDGYKMSINKDVDKTSSEWVCKIDSMLNNDITKSENSLYVSENNGTNADAYWLASPLAFGYNHMMHVAYRKQYDGNYTTTRMAFRPIICLKSNVLLKKLPEGSDYDFQLSF